MGSHFTLKKREGIMSFVRIQKGVLTFINTILVNATLEDGRV